MQMALWKRRSIWSGALLLLTVIGATSPARVLAELDPPGPPRDCPPVVVFGGDLVALNLGHANPAPAAALVATARLLNAKGETLLEHTLTLPAGQSASVQLGPLPAAGLVRGEVVPASEPVGLRLGVTLQVLRPGLPLTYGPVVVCVLSGDTPNRGPA
jgi:hypothetical protein